MTHTFVLGSLESLWHYGRLPSSNSLQNMMSSSNVTLPSLIAIASQGAGSLRSLFAVLDEDGDGRLSLHEMRSCLAKFGIISSSSSSSSQPNTHDFMPGLFEWTPSYQHTSISTHDLLSLDFPQFLQFYSSLFGASQDCPIHDSSCAHEGDGDFDDELLAAFRVYDTNRDGFISAAELAAVLIKLGLLPPADCSIDAHSSTCQAFIESVDLDGNGMVDFEEFKSMMMRSHAPTSGFGDLH